MNYLIGSKVYPAKKSMGVNLDECLVWKDALSKGQNYLYVCGCVGLTVICHNDITNEVGDFFLESDLIPYIETVSIENPVTISVKTLVDLVNQGLVNENELILVKKA